MNKFVLVALMITTFPSCKKKQTCPVCTTIADGIDIYAKIPEHSQTDTTICDDSLRAVFITQNTGTFHPTYYYSVTKTTSCK